MPKKKLITKQIETTAYSRQITHKIFYDVVEFLEKYIEIAGYYPDWDKRKQIKDNKVVRPISDSEDAEECFSIILLGFTGTIRKKPPFLREEIKKEFYKWIDAVGIDFNECHPRLRSCLVGIGEAIEGNDKKIIEEAKNAKSDLTPGSSEYARELNNFFANTQITLQKEIEIEQSLKGKMHEDIEIESNFSKGNSDKGQEVFSRIVENHDYQDFHFFPQQEQRSASSGDKVDKIDRVLKRIKLVEEIRKNSRLERGLFVINQETNEHSKNEDWFVHNQLKREFDSKTGFLIYVPNEMIRVKDLSEAEQEEVGYKSEQKLQSNFVTPKSNDEDFSSASILAIITIANVLLIASAVLTNKQFKKKNKK